MSLGPNKRLIGFVLGIVVALIVMSLHLQGVSPAGDRWLALSLFAIIWWAFGVCHPGFTALILLVSYVVMGVAPSDQVFGVWVTSLVWIVVGGYLIAYAVSESGLGKRISYMFILKFVNSYNGVIISCYVLGILLSLVIPHPFPRAFLLMTVFAAVIVAAKLPRRDAAQVGLAVFAGSASTSMIFFTGDSILNPVAASFGAAAGGHPIGWVTWFVYMGIPGLFATAITCATQLIFFRPSVKFAIDKSMLQKELDSLGAMTTKEKKTAFWVVVAIILWATSQVTKIDPGWTACLIAVALTFPVIGDVLDAKAWKSVDFGTLSFLTAALAIGTIGQYTGMNTWIVNHVFPSTVPANAYAFAAMAAGLTIVIHMCLGSLLAVLGIVGPAFVAFATKAGWNPNVAALLVYTAIVMQWALPFHSLNVLIGVGDQEGRGGRYNDMDAFKLGMPLIVGVFIVTVLIEVPYWHLIGLIR
jgi:di/tricarboxylate transporter